MTAITQTTEDTDPDDTHRELTFAILAVDENDPANLEWLAACCAKRVSYLTSKSQMIAST